jgi:hypothetical protein
MKTPVGVAAPGIITPQREPDSPVMVTILKMPTIRTEAGTIRVAKIITKNTIWPLKRYFDSAKAAIELIRSVMIVATIVTNTELFKHLTASKLPRALLVSGSV